MNVNLLFSCESSVICPLMYTFVIWSVMPKNFRAYIFCYIFGFRGFFLSYMQNLTFALVLFIPGMLLINALQTAVLWSYEKQSSSMVFYLAFSKSNILWLLSSFKNY